MTPEQRIRLDDAARMTGGTMPLIVVLPAEQLLEAAAYLRGKRWASLLELEVAVEVAKR